MDAIEDFPEVDFSSIKTLLLLQALSFKLASRSSILKTMPLLNPLKTLKTIPRNEL